MSTLRVAAECVTRVFRGLANDENDGEFALWSETDLINAIYDLDAALMESPEVLARELPEIEQR